MVIPWVGRKMPFGFPHRYSYGFDDNFGLRQLLVVRLIFDGPSMMSLFYTSLSSNGAP